MREAELVFLYMRCEASSYAAYRLVSAACRRRVLWNKQLSGVLMPEALEYPAEQHGKKFKSCQQKKWANEAEE